MCVCVCVCVCVYVYIHICIYICVYMYILLNMSPVGPSCQRSKTRKIRVKIFLAVRLSFTEERWGLINLI